MPGHRKNWNSKPQLDPGGATRLPAKPPSRYKVTGRDTEPTIRERQMQSCRMRKAPVTLAPVRGLDENE